MNALDTFAKEPRTFKRVVWDAILLYSKVWRASALLWLVFALLDWLMFGSIGVLLVVFPASWFHQVLGFAMMLWHLGSFAVLTFCVLVRTLKPDASTSSMLKEAVKGLPRFYLAWSMMAIVACLSLIIVIPGVYLLLCMPLMIPIVYFTDTPALQAFWRARCLVQGVWWYTFGAFFWLIGFCALVMIILGFLPLHHFPHFLLLSLGYIGKWLIFIPLFACITLMVTHQLLLIEQEKVADGLLDEDKNDL